MKYLMGYPDSLKTQVQQLLTQGRLGETLLAKYSHAHGVRTDKALYDYVMTLKNDFLRNSEPLNKVMFDSKLQIITHALGTHTTISRVQGNKLKSKREIRVASLFKEVPEEFLRMIAVHELAHIKDYQSRSIFGVMDRGIDYLHGRSKAKFERAIDTMTIQAGMGEYLHRWAHYAIYESNASEKYKRFKRKIYLAPEEIIGLVPE